MLLERDNELQTLEAAFQAIAGSGGRLVLVCGEAGIGKSSLLARFAEGLLQGIAGVGRPVVLVIEDLHWADDRSLDWLKFVGRRIAMLPLLLICSFRDDGVDATHPPRAALGQIPAARKAQLTLAPLSL